MNRDITEDGRQWRDRCLSVQNEFGWFLASDAAAFRPAPSVDQAFVRALTECWIRPEALAVPVARYLTAKWPRALTGTAAPGEPELFEVLRDPVLLALMRSTPAATPGLEKLLARFRHAALRATLAGKDLSPFVPTLTALAIRGWHSGYALTLPLVPRHADDRAEEAALVAELGRRLENGEVEVSQLAAAIAIYGSYAPPEQTHLQAALAAGGPNARLIEEGITLPRMRQREIAQSLVPQTPIDESSTIVADQYEEHPYPAWVVEPADDVMVPAAVSEALGAEGSRAVRSVLVAGCGTGQHAIVAARAWPGAEVLAVDVSRTSLAYAIERTRDAGLDRIDFALADLLEVGRLGRRFDIIEAMGVLHHLADPEAGLRALKQVLKPGGIIGIGLYSAAARAGLEAIRSRYGRSEAASDEEVRRFRAWALAELDAPDLLHSPDFYSIGGCRDAFFHVRERCYSLEEIGRLLDRTGLRLLALQTPPLAQESLGSVPEPTDLAGWAAAERAHPDLFLGMYELWAQDPQPAPAVRSK